VDKRSPDKMAGGPLRLPNCHAAFFGGFLIAMSWLKNKHRKKLFFPAKVLDNGSR
jgi:hypothetical protein